jgi:DNA-binding transcriptional regulator/RsmH inhibitor MraZ
LAPEPSAISQEVRPIDARGRLTIPLRLLERLSWATKAGTDYLAVLDTPGCIRILPWAAAAERVLERREALAARQDAEGLEAVRALDDRYLRLKIDASGRVVLTMPFLVHLDDQIDRIQAVYLIRRIDELEIWSVGFRNRRLLMAIAELDDLP